MLPAACASFYDWCFEMSYVCSYIYVYICTYTYIQINIVHMYKRNSVLLSRLVLFTSAVAEVF